jgi:hypothetical protein
VTSAATPLCPRCGETNRPGRVRCWVCSGALDASAESTADSGGGVFGQIVKVVLILFGVAVCGLLLFFVTCTGFFLLGGWK